MRQSASGWVGGFLAVAAVVGATSASAGQWQNGGQVYEKVCGHCHEMGVGPVIKGRKLLPEYVQRVVRHGNRAMPSFRPSEIDDAALAAVAQLISTSEPVAGQQVR